VVEDKAYYGLKKVDELKGLLPDTLKEATTTEGIIATSTNLDNIKSKIKSATNTGSLKK
jgi:hypothetical protein